MPLPMVAEFGQKLADLVPPAQPGIAQRADAADGAGVVDDHAGMMAAGQPGIGQVSRSG